MEKEWKLRKLLCIVFAMLTVSAHAQDLKIMVNAKGKVGFADQQGNEVIKCQYEGAQPFKYGVAIVSKSGKYGIIDATGAVKLPLSYTQISSWNDELYLIKSDKKMGLASHQGDIVLPVNYSHISKPNMYGKALIAVGGKSTAYEKKSYMANAKYGIIDKKGNILVNPIYKGLYEFSYDGKNVYPYYEGWRLTYSYHCITDTLETDCSYLGFSNSGGNIYEAGIIDGNGNELVKSGLYDFVMRPESNMVRYYIAKKNETLCGYHDIATGQGFQVASFECNINKFTFWSHGDFIGNIAPVNGNTWSFIDKSGNKLRSGYSKLKHNRWTGLWAAKNTQGTWDVFDDENNDVAALSNYSEINFPNNEGDKEIFCVKKGEKYGAVKRSGETVIPFNYEMAHGNTYDMIAVKKGGKWGMLSPEDAVLVPMEYVDMKLPSERNTKHVWVKKADSLYYHYNLTSKRLSQKGYKEVSNFEKGIALVAPVGLKIDDTPLNRAQMFVPNTERTKINTYDMSQCNGAFGYLLNTDDVILMNLPVSTLYKDYIIKEIEKRGGRALTEMESKNLLLEATRENRSYYLSSVLKEDEWDY